MQVTTTNYEVKTNDEESLPFQFPYVKVKQVPHYCTFAAKLLESQPQFNGKGSQAKKNNKVIALDSRHDAKIFEIFNEHAVNFIEKKSAWSIHSFGGSTNVIRDANNKIIKCGLDLWCDPDLERCSLETLERAYIDVYQSMRKGWVESNPQEYQGTMFEKDSEKFAFFVKTRTINREEELIGFLSNKFKLNDKIMCYWAWSKKEGGYGGNDKIYMWIDKEDRLEIIKKFGFDL